MNIFVQFIWTLIYSFASGLVAAFTAISKFKPLYDSINNAKKMVFFELIEIPDWYCYVMIALVVSTLIIAVANKVLEKVLYWQR